MIQRTWATQRSLIVTIIVAAGVYLMLLPVFTTRLDPLTGDEPFYVMTAISLLRDRDLDESNNYANRDYLEFYPADPLPADWRGWPPGFPRELPPHPAVSVLDGLHTKHGLGLSFAIALPYAIGGRIGADLLIIACGALLAGQMYLLGREAGASERLAMAIALGLAVSMPIAPYAMLVFPEVPAALLLLFAVRRVAAAENAAWQMLLAGAAIGFLPWLHQRFGPTALVLGIIMALRWRRTSPVWPYLGALGVIGLGGALLVAYNQWLYGQPLQNTQDHAGFSGVQGTLNGLFGVLLDAQWGLLIAAPVLILALGALPWWWDASKRTLLITAAAVAPYILLVAAYKVWWGEWGPPARYLVPIVPFAAGPLAAWLARVPRGWRVLPLALWSAGMTLTLIGFRNPQRFYHQPDGNNNLVRHLDGAIGTHLTDRLVAFQPLAQAPRNERDAAAFLFLAALIGAYLVTRVVPTLLNERAGSRNRSRRAPS